MYLYEKDMEGASKNMLCIKRQQRNNYFFLLLPVDDVLYGGGCSFGVVNGGVHESAEEDV